MKYLRSTLAGLGLALAASAAQAAPVEPAGAPDEQLGIALALGEACQSYRHFEFTYLHDTWFKIWARSEARSAIDKQADAANIGPNGLIDAAMVRETEEKRVIAGYRERAAAIGCENGAKYIDLGRIEAFKAIGVPLMLAASMRGQENVPPDMEPLHPYDREAVEAFVGEVQRLFGSDAPRYDQVVQALAQQRLSEAAQASMAIGADFAAFDLMQEQNAAIAAVMFDLRVPGTGYMARGRLLDGGDPLRGTGARVSKEGMPGMLLAGEITPISVQPVDPAAPSYRGAMALMLRPDGSITIGVFGAHFERFDGALTVAAKADKTAPIIAAREPGCLLAHCFRIDPADAARLANTSRLDDPPIRFFASARPNPVPGEDGLDGITLGANKLQRLLAQARAN